MKTLVSSRGTPSAAHAGVVPVVSSVVAGALLFAHTPGAVPSVAVLPVDASAAELAASDVDALRSVVTQTLGRESDARASTDVPRTASPADVTVLSRTLAAHGVSHWLVTRVEGRERTYEIEMELWAVGDREPVVRVHETCAICGQAELRDLVRSEARRVDLALVHDGDGHDAEAAAPTEATAERRRAPTRAPRIDRPTRDPAFRIVGYVTLSAGAVGLVAGSTLIALDGREIDRRCAAAGDAAIDADGDCRYVHQTLGAGIALVAGGVLASAGGITLLALDARKRRRAEVSMRVGFRRVSLVGRF